MPDRKRRSRPGFRVGRGLVLGLVGLALGCRQSGTSPGARSPGTAPELSSSERQIRVQLAEGVAAVQIVVDGPWELRDGNGRVLASDAQLPFSYRIEPLADGPRGFRAGPPDSVWNVEALEIVPLAGTVTVRFPDAREAATVHGSVRCVATGSNGTDVINCVDMEDYLKGVVGSEMPDTFAPEALRAQAIAARTYAFYQRNTVGRSRSYDVRADQSSQVYGGVACERRTPRAVEAVEATRGIVCTWEAPDRQRIFCAYYSSMCGGVSQSAENLGKGDTAGPLRGGVSCEYCSGAASCEWGPQRWSKDVVTTRLRSRFPRLREIGRIEKVYVVETTPDGRPTRIAVEDADGRGDVLRAEEFRLAVDPTGRLFRSTRFRVGVDRDGVTFSDGRGYGHGVGLCQWGAQDMARRGATAGRILAHYYPGCRLALAYR